MDLIGKQVLSSKPYAPRRIWLSYGEERKGIGGFLSPLFIPQLWSISRIEKLMETKEKGDET